jgi:hypothetical protein
MEQRSCLQPWLNNAADHTHRCATVIANIWRQNLFYITGDAVYEVKLFCTLHVESKSNNVTEVNNANIFQSPINPGLSPVLRSAQSRTKNLQGEIF